LKIRKTVGIDLRTTNSVIAVLDPTDSYLITGRDEAGHQTFPSVVGYQAEAQARLVGHAARRVGGGPAAVRSVKRFMGLERSFAVGPEALTPADISARILRHLRDVLGRTLADQRYVLDSAIITMPAYFNHNQIEVTRRAGELAGLEVVELLHEPTAAAIYYGWRLNHVEATYLVYDLGGGTFDASVIRRRHGDYEVVSVSGDPFLGGDDFDRLLASYLVSSGQVRGGNLDLSPGTPNFDRLQKKGATPNTERNQVWPLSWLFAVVSRPDASGGGQSLECVPGDRQALVAIGPVTAARGVAKRIAGAVICRLHLNTQPSRGHDSEAGFQLARKTV
jgi:molecular chaperone DnaK